jgi:AAA domain/TIR domain
VATDPDVLNPLMSPGLFVGRGKQLADLAELARQGRSALVVGGRRAGKSTLVRHLTSDTLGRHLVFTDVAGWNLASEETALAGLRSAIEKKPETAYQCASRGEVVGALEDIRPVTLIMDEADRVLLAPWGPGFYSFLRWLDDAHFRSDIAIILVGGPVLVLFKDPEDRGSPPLNTAELRYIEPLDGNAVSNLAELAQYADHGLLMKVGGGQAWLTTRLLAEVWDGTSLDEASEIVFDRAIGTFRAWERQLGASSRELIRKFPSDGLSRGELRRAPWSRYREAASIARCVGALRLDGDRICLGPRLFIDWLGDRDPDELVWDIAISYATEDESLARQIYTQIRHEFKVFFAPDEAAALWGTELSRVLPNTYGIQSKYVLVLSTSHYVSKYWTRIEFDAAATLVPDRILLLDLGELPSDCPKGLVYRGSSAAEMVGLIGALRRKLQPQ